MANMLYRARLTIVHSECGLSEPLRNSSFLNFACERWSGDLVECFTHSIISQASRRWISVFMLIMVVFIIRERLSRRSPWSMPITTILFTIRREVKSGGALFRRSWRKLLFKWSISVYMTLVFFSWERWLPPLEWLLVVRVVCTCERPRPWLVL